MPQIKRIAILADYPVWLIDPSITTFIGHYAVWLTALSEVFSTQKQFEVHWVVLSKSVDKAKHVKHNGQLFHILPRARKKIGLYSFCWHDSRLIQKQIKEIQPDLIHAWGTEDCYGFAVRSFNGAKILSIQGLLTACLRHSEVFPFERKQCFYEKITLKAFQHITAESPWAIQQAQYINPNAEYKLFEYAVETPFFHQERDIAEQPCCLFAGSDRVAKNVNLLIEAFSRPELSHIRLKLAGPYPHVRTNLPSNIEVLGRVSREGMLKLLAETWCIVHASLADCAPNIANEARVMGIPVILTENCGSKQHVEHGKSGYIFEPHDIEKFIQYVLTVCQSKEMSLEMGSYHRERERSLLSKNLMIDRLIKTYNQMLSHKRLNETLQN